MICFRKSVGKLIFICHVIEMAKYGGGRYIYKVITLHNNNIEL